MSKCPLCNGSGERLLVVRDPKRGTRRLASQYCWCKVSRYVSDQYRLLDFLGDEYLPPDKVDESCIFYPDSLPKSPNLIIRQTDMNSFLLNVKSVIMRYRFFHEPSCSIFFSQAIDVLHNFYVKQEDGTAPHLSNTDKYDLMIITLDTQEKNAQLNTVIAQVVQMRKNRRPTWLYQPMPTLESCKQEYSEELEEMVKLYYHPVTLGSVKKNIKSKIPGSHDDIANWGRTS